MTRPALLALGLALSGCTASLGTAGVLSLDPDAVGLKLLRPGVAARSCRATIAGIPLAAGDPDLREAMQQLLALDPEGNVIANADLRWRWVVTGFYNRRCVEVRGDLARTVSVITVPAPPGHHGHH